MFCIPRVHGLSPLLLVWVLGTAMQLFQPVLWSCSHYALWPVLGLLVLGVCWRIQTLNIHLKLLAAVLFVASLSFASVGCRAWWFQQEALPSEYEGVDVQIIGVVSSMPQWSMDGWRFRFQPRSAQRLHDGQLIHLPTDMQLGWYNQTWDGERKTLPVVHAGDHWQFTVRLKQPHGLVNPGGFDAELWFWEQGIQATGHVRDGTTDPPAVLLENSWLHPVERLRQTLRTSIAQTVPEPRWAGLISALLIGDQAAIERADWDLFRITGIAHLMSISGLHITLWAWMARRLILQVWRYSDAWGRSWCLCCPAPWAASWGGVVCAAAYAVFSGWGVPAQRTVIMLSVACVLQIRALRWPLLPLWLLAMVAVLILDPWALLQAGFWLSFVAVGILFLSPPPSQRDFKNTSKLQSMGRRSLQLLQEQLQITVCLAPLGVILFQQLSVVGLLVNLLAIPWVTLVVTPLAFLGSVWSPLWLLCSLSLQMLCAVLEPMSTWSWAVWQVAAPPWWVAAIGMMGGAWVAGSVLWKKRIWGLLLMTPCLWWPVSRPTVGQFSLLAADIGQGNAVLVRTAQHSLLFDTGPRFGSDSDAGQRVLLPLLQHSNERLDTLVLSHQDSDHTGGALSVQRTQPQLQVLSSISAGQALFGRWSMQRCEAGQRWQWDGVQFEVLHPLAKDYDQLLSPNARSCVLRISAGTQVALLTADIEAFQEQALVERMGAHLKADVLLVPHHGSKTSSTNLFLDAVQPRWALFQMGYRNRYGHPAPSVLDRYVQRGIAFKQSPSCGAMHWRSDKPDEMRCERQAHLRYWRHQI